MSMTSVHPRLRGELSGNESGSVELTGSSPLTRGTLRSNRIAVAVRRFIPAYAGNSPLMQAMRVMLAVHPRLRGELGYIRRQVLCMIGSSPLTRGTLGAVMQSAQLGRFIPAYAGNSGLRYSDRSSQAVHPRLRGELSIAIGQCPSSVGSSPLTRGTHGNVSFSEMVGRFIPAYAGNSYQNRK